MPYYPLGIGDCVVDLDHSGSPLDNWGLDGGFRPAGVEAGRTIDMETYLSAYQAAGINLFRWSVDNCCFGLSETIGPAGRKQDRIAEGRFGDQLVRALRAHGKRVFMIFFGFKPPFTQDPKPAELAAVERYVKYVVDRYGAYVDFWELMNEASASERWYSEVAGYLRRVDPYRHPISTSWGRPELAAIEINAPHWYEREDEFASDTRTLEQFAAAKRYGKPVIFGEQGNGRGTRPARQWRVKLGFSLCRAYAAPGMDGILRRGEPRLLERQLRQGRPRVRSHLSRSGGAALPGCAPALRRRLRPPRAAHFGAGVGSQPSAELCPCGLDSRAASSRRR